MQGGYTIPKEDTFKCPECGKTTHAAGKTLTGQTITNCQHIVGAARPIGAVAQEN